MPPAPGCPETGPPSPEVTGAFCRVPSTQFSQAPRYALPVHLCRFRVRSIGGGCFPERLRRPDNPISPDDLRHSSPSHGPGTINPVPIGYGFRPRLRGRLTLRGLALRRNPWTCGGSVSRTPDRYSCQHSRFRCLQGPSRKPLRRPTERSATTSEVRRQKSGVRRSFRLQGLCHFLERPCSIFEIS